jgi:hypothetical protein
MGSWAKETWFIVDSRDEMVASRMTILGARRKVADALGCHYKEVTVEPTDTDAPILHNGELTGYRLAHRNYMEEM